MRRENQVGLNKRENKCGKRMGDFERERKSVIGRREKSRERSLKNRERIKHIDCRET